MGLFRCDASILLLSGKDLLTFLDGLSTNQISGPCTAPFTKDNAKIIDVCDLIPVGDNIALVGYAKFKANLVDHLSLKILGRQITITDISHLNDVFIGTPLDHVPQGVTVHQSTFGWMMIAPKSTSFVPTWTEEEWSEFRVMNSIPFHGHEITQDRHPYSCGLETLVHPQKGCYVGQEILTRMRTRGKTGKTMHRELNPVEQATTVGLTHSLCIKRV